MITPNRPVYESVKRIVDVVGALLGLLLLFPLFVVLTALILVASPGPVLHRRRVLARQTPVDGPLAVFDAFKFRTMITDADAYLESRPELLEAFQKDYKLRDDPRVTRIGRLLRRTSLDELPQLLNVLAGQMSLVGPRMITAPELALYGEHGARLLSVRPGLTGLWQVSGRQDLSYEQRVQLDMHYLDRRSLRLDLAILWRTVGSVLRRQGAY